MNVNEVICPIHKDSHGCVPFWEFNYDGVTYSLYECQSCELAFYSPFPQIDYQTHTDNISSLKDYVHVNSNIEGLIQNVLNHFPEEGYASMIEVGCGFGFTLDFVKNIFGIEITGYEPSLYGEIGARELNLNIQRTYLTEEVIKHKKADLVYLSEVLEHIEDAAPFIALLKKALTKNGVFILTTPNYKALKKDLNVPSELALLSPGAHTILFSPKSLEKLLRDAGFQYVSVSTSGHSLLAVSTVTDKTWKTFEDKNALLREYFINVLNRVKADSLVYTGILYRLLRNYIDHGNYEEAHKILKQYPFPVLPTMVEINNAQTAGELNEIGPACSAILAYYIGMMQLNYYSDFNAASANFQISFLLCQKKLLLAPDASVLEFETLWLANYHYALSLFHKGDYNLAIKELKKIKKFEYNEDNRSLPLPDSHVIEQADQLLALAVERL